MHKLLAVLATLGFAASAGAAFADPHQPYGMDRNSGHQHSVGPTSWGFNGRHPQQ